MAKVVGIFFFLAGTFILLGILTAEIFYPTNYSVSLNMISNLGSTPPPDSIIRQPSASIFDHSLILAGLLILLGTYFFSKKNKLFIVAAALMGIGTFGVGIFPAFHMFIHPFVALLAFLFGGLAAVVSSRVTKQPFSLFSILLGVTSLLFLFLGIVFPKIIVPILGIGGTERWVLYPLVIWLIGFGSYLMNTTSVKKK